MNCFILFSNPGFCFNKFLRVKRAEFIKAKGVPPTSDYCFMLFINPGFSDAKFLRAKRAELLMQKGVPPTPPNQAFNLVQKIYSTYITFVH